MPRDILLVTKKPRDASTSGIMTDWIGVDVPRLPALFVACEFDGCNRQVRAKGLCSAHYKQAAKGKKLVPVRKLDSSRGCRFDGCRNTHFSKDLCQGHFTQFKAGLELIELGAWREREWVKSQAGYMVRSMRDADGGSVKVSQHRVIIEEMLGRPLVKGENVHHINGVRHDNRPENLELWNTRQPAGQRIEDKLAWADEIIALYRPEVLALAA